MTCVLLAAHVGARAEQLPLKAYTTADGLWSSAVSDLVRDSRGFMWLCTRDGLSRFDGYRFTNYTIKNAASPTVSSLLETRAGIYWVSVQDGGLYRFDAATTSGTSGRNRTNDLGRLTIDAERVSSDQVSTLYEQRDGQLWVAGNRGLFAIDDREGRVTLRRVPLPVVDDASATIASMRDGADGSLWLLTQSQGLLRRLPDARVVRYRFDRQLSARGSSRVVIDEGGRLWIGDYKGLTVFNPEPLSALATAGVAPMREVQIRERAGSGGPLMPARPNEAIDVTAASLGLTERPAVSGSPVRVRGLLRARDNRIWILVGNGLAVFDADTFEFYDTRRGRLPNMFGALAEDADGNIWSAGTGGAFRLSVRGLTTFDEADGLPALEIAALYEDTGGALNVVSIQGYLSRLAGGRFTTVRPDIPAQTQFSWTSTTGLLDRNGAWWLLSQSGLFRFPRTPRIEALAHARPSAIYTRNDGLKGNDVYCGFEDSRGDLWISTRGPDAERNGLMKWSRARGSFQTFTAADGLPPRVSASSFAEDRAGTLWFGFYQGGLVKYSGGRFAFVDSGDEAFAGVITALHVDRSDRLWVASSSGGLTRIDRFGADHPRIARLTTADGLSSNNVRSLTEDLAGNLYAGTVSGIDRIDGSSGAIGHFGMADGLAGDFVGKAYRDRAGALWFGTPNGLSRLVPAPVVAPAAPPNILINGVLVAGVRRPISDLGVQDAGRLELRAGQSNVQIEFFSLNLAHASLLRYQQQLEGADAGWSAPSEQRTVAYANLAPGTYRFRVRAISPEGVMSDHPATLAFFIPAPIWQRWWFITIAALALAVLARSTYRYRVGRLLELERVRTRIATDLHDDVGSSLSRIAIVGEVIKQQLGGAASPVADRLGEMTNTARGLVDSMGDIVWSVDPAHDDLGSVVSRLRHFASDVIEGRGARFDLQAAPEIGAIPLAPEQRRHLFLILKEAINNAARHAECRAASLSMSVSNQRLTATVRDDGRGFSAGAAASPQGGNGLTNMARRATALGGSLEVESADGQGTKVTLSMPLRWTAGA